MVLARDLEGLSSSNFGSGPKSTDHRMTLYERKDMRFGFRQVCLKIETCCKLSVSKDRAEVGLLLLLSL